MYQYVVIIVDHLKVTLLLYLILCDRFDIVCIQEHWLLPSDFMFYLHISITKISSCASSAIDVGVDILVVGGPMGAQLIYLTEHLLIVSNMFIVAILE